MKKNLNHYLALPYRIEIVHIPEDEGGGYMARLPQFGAMGIVGDGDTKEEALADLENSQRERFQYYLEEGLEIPEPEIADDNFSGRFLVRLPKFLHRELAQAAQQNGVSLNQYVCTLLAMNFQTDRLAATLTGMQDEIQSLNQCIGALKYHVKKTEQSGNYDTRTLFADEYPKAA